jgi:hypothetical protein
MKTCLRLGYLVTSFSSPSRVVYAAVYACCSQSSRGVGVFIAQLVTFAGIADTVIGRDGLIKLYPTWVQLQSLDSSCHVAKHM